jgi:hypothetical protein
VDETAGQRGFLVGFAGRGLTALDPVFHLAKVEVAGSNPVIRSRAPEQDPSRFLTSEGPARGVGGSRYGGGAVGRVAVRRPVPDPQASLRPGGIS